MAETINPVEAKEMITFHTQMRRAKDGEEADKWRWCCGDGHHEFSTAVTCHEMTAKMIAGTYIPKNQAEAVSLQRILAMQEGGGRLETRLVKFTVAQKVELIGGEEMLGKSN